MDGVTVSRPVADATRTRRAYWAIACLLILAGATLRTLGYFEPVEFWSDEAAWAERFADGNLGTLRPIGYTWLSLKLIELRATEPVIRSLSYAAGLLSLPVLLAMLRSSGLGRTVSLLGLFVLAAHPVAITLSKEFKPYALELCLHLCLLALAFAYARQRKWWQIVALCVLAAGAPFFAWSVVVLYPGLFLAVAIVSLRSRDKYKLGTIVLGAVATIGSLIWIYINVISNRTPRAGYWGRKYDVFFVGEGVPEKLWWFVEKTYDLFSFPAYLKVFWVESAYPNRYLAVLSVAAVLGGLIVIAVRRKWLWALLWVSPWLVAVALNVIGKWPYGVFRTNLFMLAYMLPIALVGLHALGRWLAGRFDQPIAWGLRGTHAVPTFCILYALVCLPLSLSYFKIKPAGTHAPTQSTRRAMEIIAEVERQGRSPFRERKGRDALLMDSHAYVNYRFYRKLHPETKEELGPFLNQRLRARKGGYGAKRLLRWMKRESRWGFWLVVNKRSLVEPAKKQAFRLCRVDHMSILPENNLVLRCLPTAARQ